MYEFMKTILSALQTWVNKRIKSNTPNWNENDSEADGYIKNRPFYTDGDEVVQIDKKYLPDAKTYLDENVFSPDYEIYDEKQVGYIKNRPCYYQVQECMNAEAITTSASSSNYVAHNGDSVAFIEGTTYLIKGTLCYTTNSGEIKKCSFEKEVTCHSNDCLRTYLYPDAINGDFYINHIYSNDATSEYAGKICITDYYGGLQIATNDLQITITTVKQLDEAVIPDTIARVEATSNTIDERIATAKNYITFVDRVNGYTYVVEMCEGNIVSYCAIKSIEAATLPIKTAYVHSEYFDATGVVVTATCEDGSTKEVTNFTYPTTYLAEGTTSVEITCVDAGVTYTTTIPVTVSAFDPAVVLVDFTYTDNGDGTYTITGWNGTYNGEASTEMIIPNYGCIIV